MADQPPPPAQNQAPGNPAPQQAPAAAAAAAAAAPAAAVYYVFPFIHPTVAQIAAIIENAGQDFAPGLPGPQAMIPLSRETQQYLYQAFNGSSRPAPSLADDNAGFAERTSYWSADAVDLVPSFSSCMRFIVIRSLSFGGKITRERLEDCVVWASQKVFSGEQEDDVKRAILQAAGSSEVQTAIAAQADPNNPANGTALSRIFLNTVFNSLFSGETTAAVTNRVFLAQVPGIDGPVGDPLFDGGNSTALLQLMAANELVTVGSLCLGNETQSTWLEWQHNSAHAFKYQLMDAVRRFVSGTPSARVAALQTTDATSSSFYNSMSAGSNKNACLENTSVLAIIDAASFRDDNHQPVPANVVKIFLKNISCPWVCLFFCMLHQKAISTDPTAIQDDKSSETDEFRALALASLGPTSADKPTARMNAALSVVSNCLSSQLLRLLQMQAPAPDVFSVQLSRFSSPGNIFDTEITIAKLLLTLDTSIFTSKLHLFGSSKTEHASAVRGSHMDRHSFDMLLRAAMSCLESVYDKMVLDSDTETLYQTLESLLSQFDADPALNVFSGCTEFIHTILEPLYGQWLLHYVNRIQNRSRHLPLLRDDYVPFQTYLRPTYMRDLCLPVHTIFTQAVTQIFVKHSLAKSAKRKLDEKAKGKPARDPGNGRGPNGGGGKGGGNGGSGGGGGGGNNRGNGGGAGGGNNRGNGGSKGGGSSGSGNGSGKGGATGGGSGGGNSGGSSSKGKDTKGSNNKGKGGSGRGDRGSTGDKGKGGGKKGGGKKGRSHHAACPPCNSAPVGTWINQLIGLFDTATDFSGVHFLLSALFVIMIYASSLHEPGYTDSSAAYQNLDHQHVGITFRDDVVFYRSFGHTPPVKCDDAFAHMHNSTLSAIQLQLKLPPLKSDDVAQPSAKRQRLSAVSSDLTAVSSDLTAVSSDLTALSSGLSAVSSDMTALSSDLSEVSSDLTALSSGLSAVSSDLTADCSRAAPDPDYAASHVEDTHRIFVKLENTSSPPSSQAPQDAHWQQHAGNPTTISLAKARWGSALAKARVADEQVAANRRSGHASVRSDVLKHAEALHSLSQPRARGTTNSSSRAHQHSAAIFGPGAPAPSSIGTQRIGAGAFLTPLSNTSPAPIIGAHQPTTDLQPPAGWSVQPARFDLATNTWKTHVIKANSTEVNITATTRSLMDAKLRWLFSTQAARPGVTHNRAERWTINPVGNSVTLVNRSTQTVETVFREPATGLLYLCGSVEQSPSLFLATPRSTPQCQQPNSSTASGGARIVTVLFRHAGGATMGHPPQSDLLVRPRSSLFRANDLVTCRSSSCSLYNCHIQLMATADGDDDDQRITPLHWNDSPDSDGLNSTVSSIVYCSECKQPLQHLDARIVAHASRLTTRHHLLTAGPTATATDATRYGGSCSTHVPRSQFKMDDAGNTHVPFDSQPPVLAAASAPAPEPVPCPPNITPTPPAPPIWVYDWLVLPANQAPFDMVTHNALRAEGQARNQAEASARAVCEATAAAAAQADRLRLATSSASARSLKRRRDDDAADENTSPVAGRRVYGHTAAELTASLPARWALSFPPTVSASVHGRTTGSIYLDASEDETHAITPRHRAEYRARAHRFGHIHENLVPGFLVVDHPMLTGYADRQAMGVGLTQQQQLGIDVPHPGLHAVAMGGYGSDYYSEIIATAHRLADFLSDSPQRQPPSGSPAALPPAPAFKTDDSARHGVRQSPSMISKRRQMLRHSAIHTIDQHSAAISAAQRAAGLGTTATHSHPNITCLHLNAAQAVLQASGSTLETWALEAGGSTRRTHQLSHAIGGMAFAQAHIERAEEQLNAATAASERGRRTREINAANEHRQTNAPRQRRGATSASRRNEARAAARRSNSARAAGTTSGKGKGRHSRPQGKGARTARPHNSTASQSSSRAASSSRMHDAAARARTLESARTNAIYEHAEAARKREAARQRAAYGLDHFPVPSNRASYNLSTTGNATFDSMSLDAMEQALQHPRGAAVSTRHAGRGVTASHAPDAYNGTAFAAQASASARSPQPNLHAAAARLAAADISPTELLRSTAAASAAAAAASFQVAQAQHDIAVADREAAHQALRSAAMHGAIAADAGTFQQPQQPHGTVNSAQPHHATSPSHQPAWNSPTRFPRSKSDDDALPSHAPPQPLEVLLPSDRQTIHRDRSTQDIRLHLVSSMMISMFKSITDSSSWLLCAAETVLLLAMQHMVRHQLADSKARAGSQPSAEHGSPGVTSTLRETPRPPSPTQFAITHEQSQTADSDNDPTSFMQQCSAASRAVFTLRSMVLSALGHLHVDRNTCKCFTEATSRSTAGKRLLDSRYICRTRHSPIRLVGISQACSLLNTMNQCLSLLSTLIDSLWKAGLSVISAAKRLTALITGTTRHHPDDEIVAAAESASSFARRQWRSSAKTLQQRTSDALPVLAAHAPALLRFAAAYDQDLRQEASAGEAAIHEGRPKGESTSERRRRRAHIAANSAMLTSATAFIDSFETLPARISNFYSTIVSAIFDLPASVRIRKTLKARYSEGRAYFTNHLDTSRHRATAAWVNATTAPAAAFASQTPATEPADLTYLLDPDGTATQPSGELLSPPWSPIPDRYDHATQSYLPAFGPHRNPNPRDPPPPTPATVPVADAMGQLGVDRGRATSVPAGNGNGADGNSRSSQRQQPKVTTKGSSGSSPAASNSISKGSGPAGNGSDKPPSRQGADGEPSVPPPSRAAAVDAERRLPITIVMEPANPTFLYSDSEGRAHTKKSRRLLPFHAEPAVDDPSVLELHVAETATVRTVLTALRHLIHQQDVQLFMETAPDRAVQRLPGRGTELKAQCIMGLVEPGYSGSHLFLGCHLLLRDLAFDSGPEHLPFGPRFASGSNPQVLLRFSIAPNVADNTISAMWICAVPPGMNMVTYIGSASSRRAQARPAAVARAEGHAAASVCNHPFCGAASIKVGQLMRSVLYTASNSVTATFYTRPPSQRGKRIRPLNEREEVGPVISVKTERINEQDYVIIEVPPPPDPTPTLGAAGAASVFIIASTNGQAWLEHTPGDDAAAACAMAIASQWQPRSSIMRSVMAQYRGAPEAPGDKHVLVITSVPFGVTAPPNLPFPAFAINIIATATINGVLNMIRRLFLGDELENVLAQAPDFAVDKHAHGWRAELFTTFRHHNCRLTLSNPDASDGSTLDNSARLLDLTFASNMSPTTVPQPMQPAGRPFNDSLVAGCRPCLRLCFLHPPPGYGVYVHNASRQLPDATAPLPSTAAAAAVPSRKRPIDTAPSGAPQQKRPPGAVAGAQSTPATASDASSEADSDGSTNSSEYKSGNTLTYHCGDSSGPHTGCGRTKGMSPGTVCPDCTWYNPRYTVQPDPAECGRFVPAPGTVRNCTDPLYLPGPAPAAPPPAAPAAPQQDAGRRSAPRANGDTPIGLLAVTVHFIEALEHDPASQAPDPWTQTAVAPWLQSISLRCGPTSTVQTVIAGALAAIEAAPAAAVRQHIPTPTQYVYDAGNCHDLARISSPHEPTVHLSSDMRLVDLHFTTGMAIEGDVSFSKRFMKRLAPSLLFKWEGNPSAVFGRLKTDSDYFWDPARTQPGTSPLFPDLPGEQAERFEQLQKARKDFQASERLVFELKRQQELDLAAKAERMQTDAATARSTKQPSTRASKLRRPTTGGVSSAESPAPAAAGRGAPRAAITSRPGHEVRGITSRGGSADNLQLNVVNIVVVSATMEPLITTERRYTRQHSVLAVKQSASLSIKADDTLPDADTADLVCIYFPSPEGMQTGDPVPTIQGEVQADSTLLCDIAPEFAERLRTGGRPTLFFSIKLRASAETANVDRLARNAASQPMVKEAVDSCPSHARPALASVDMHSSSGDSSDEYEDLCAQYVRSKCESCAHHVRSMCDTCAKHVRTMRAPNIFNIVLTGAPAGSKSTSMKVLDEILRGLKFVVIIVPEAATSLFTQLGDPATGQPLDVTSLDAPALAEIQKLIFVRQWTAEKFAAEEAAAAARFGAHVVVLHDRALPDSEVFTPAAAWKALTEQCPVEMHKYHLVIELGSTATLPDVSLYNFGHGSTNAARGHDRAASLALCDSFRDIYCNVPEPAADFRRIPAHKLACNKIRAVVTTVFNAIPTTMRSTIGGLTSGQLLRTLLWQTAIRKAGIIDKSNAMTSCQHYVTSCDVVVKIRVADRVLHCHLQDITLRLDAAYNSTDDIYNTIVQYISCAPADLPTPFPVMPPIGDLRFSCMGDGQELGGWLNQLPCFYHRCTVLCDMRCPLPPDTAPQPMQASAGEPVGGWRAFSARHGISAPSGASDYWSPSCGGMSPSGYAMSGVPQAPQWRHGCRYIPQAVTSLEIDDEATVLRSRGLAARMVVEELHDPFTLHVRCISNATVENLELRVPRIMHPNSLRELIARSWRDWGEERGDPLALRVRLPILLLFEGQEMPPNVDVGSLQRSDSNGRSRSPGMVTAFFSEVDLPTRASNFAANFLRLHRQELQHTLLHEAAWPIHANSPTATGSSWRSRSYQTSTPPPGLLDLTVLIGTGVPTPIPSKQAKLQARQPIRNVPVFSYDVTADMAQGDPKFAQDANHPATPRITVRPHDKRAAALEGFAYYDVNVEYTEVIQPQFPAPNSPRPPLFDSAEMANPGAASENSQIWETGNFRALTVIDSGASSSDTTRPGKDIGAAPDPDAFEPDATTATLFTPRRVCISALSTKDRLRHQSNDLFGPALRDAERHAQMAEHERSSHVTFPPRCLQARHEQTLAIKADLARLFTLRSARSRLAWAGAGLPDQCAASPVLLLSPDLQQLLGRLLLTAHLGGHLGAQHMSWNSAMTATIDSAPAVFELANAADLRRSAMKHDWEYWSVMIVTDQIGCWRDLVSQADIEELEAQAHIVRLPGLEGMAPNVQQLFDTLSARASALRHHDVRNAPPPAAGSEFRGFHPDGTEFTGTVTAPHVAHPKYNALFEVIGYPRHLNPNPTDDNPAIVVPNDFMCPIVAPTCFSNRSSAPDLLRVQWKGRSPDMLDPFTCKATCLVPWAPPNKIGTLFPRWRGPTSPPPRPVSDAARSATCTMCGHLFMADPCTTATSQQLVGPSAPRYKRHCDDCHATVAVFPAMGMLENMLPSHRYPRSYTVFVLAIGYAWRDNHTRYADACMAVDASVNRQQRACMTPSTPRHNALATAVTERDNVRIFMHHQPPQQPSRHPVSGELSLRALVLMNDDGLHAAPLHPADIMFSHAWCKHIVQPRDIVVTVTCDDNVIGRPVPSFLLRLEPEYNDVVDIHQAVQAYVNAASQYLAASAGAAQVTMGTSFPKVESLIFTGFLPAFPHMAIGIPHRPAQPYTPTTSCGNADGKQVPMQHGDYNDNGSINCSKDAFIPHAGIGIPNGIGVPNLPLLSGSRVHIQARSAPPKQRRPDGTVVDCRQMHADFSCSVEREQPLTRVDVPVIPGGPHVPSELGRHNQYDMMTFE